METNQLLDILASALDQYVSKDNLLYMKTKLDLLYAKKADVPTKVSDLTNDSGYQTAENIASVLLAYAKKTEIPTNVSQLTNDAGYDTAASVNSKLESYAKKTELPTSVSDLENDSGYINDTELAAKGYQTSSQVETAITSKGYQTSAQVESIVTGKGYQTASQVQAMVNNAQHMKREIVSALPDTSAANELTIYLVENDKGSYDEYMLINGKMDKVGASDVDLTGYLNTTNFTPLSNEEIDAIFS